MEPADDDFDEMLNAMANDPTARMAPQLLATLFFCLGAAVVNTFTGGGLTVAHLGGVLGVAVAATWMRGKLSAVL